VFSVAWLGPPGAKPPSVWHGSLELMFILSAIIGMNGNMWGMVRMIPGLTELIKWLCILGPPLTLLIFYFVAKYAAWRIERSWQDKIPSRRRESLVRRYCTPVFGDWWRRRMQRSMDRNPIAWLQQYSLKARAAKWGLCAVFLTVEGLTMGDRPGNSGMVQMCLLLTLAGVCTFVGVSGFLEEKRSGALELLLVTPISVNKLIFGRVWGLWIQFAPAAVIWAGFAVCDMWGTSSAYLNPYEVFRQLFVMACAFFTLPVFATYFALRVKNLVVGAVLTWVALGAPAMLAEETGYFLRSSGEPDAILVFFSYGAFAALTCFMLRHSLSRRIYSF
jgi:hypothetical protein